MRMKMRMRLKLIILALSIWSCQAAKQNCPRPALENGFLVPHRDIYEHGVSVSYGCDTGLKPALSTWWGEITCTDGEWSHTPECIDKTSCIPPRVPHAEPVRELKSSYSNADKVAFWCNKGFETDRANLEAQCVDGEWVVPECKRKRSSCGPPPRVDNGMIIQPYQDVFEHADWLEYVCAKGYKLKSYKYNHCRNGEWDSEIQCEKIMCNDNPVMPQGTAVGQLKAPYNIGERVEFKCRSSYEFTNTNFAECVDGTWALPVCRSRGETTCQTPSVDNAVVVGFLRPPVSTGLKVEFKCNTGYEFQGTSFAVCENGAWELPVCTRFVHGGGAGPKPGVSTSSVRDCGGQPLIQNGDVTEIPDEGHLKVVCKRFYKLVGHEKVSCSAGQWSELPVCKPPCQMDKTQFPIYETYEYLKEGDSKRFRCDTYYYSYMDVTCNNGQLESRGCVSGK